MGKSICLLFAFIALFCLTGVLGQMAAVNNQIANLQTGYQTVVGQIENLIAQNVGSLTTEQVVAFQNQIAALQTAFASNIQALQNQIVALQRAGGYY